MRSVELAAWTSVFRFKRADTMALPRGTSYVILAVLTMPAMISSENEAFSSRARSTDHLPFAFSDGNDGGGAGSGGENVTVQVGSTAYLHCPVINLGERDLSWVRRSDWQILTHNTRTFTTDDRFQLVRQKEGAEGEQIDDWALQIKYVTARDSGIYECQVNTAAGIRSRRADLKVVTPEAFILADEEYHIDRGSSLSLVCIIEKATAPPQYVFWYHNERMINYDSERGISVTTTPGRRTHSQLFIQRAEVSDSGNYTCAPSSSLPASISVFVSGSEVKPWTTGGAVRMSPSSLAPIMISLFFARWTSLLCSLQGPS